MIQKETEYEIKIYPFLTQKELEAEFPDDKEIQDRIVSTAECVHVSKLTRLIGFSSWSMDSDQAGLVIKALQVAREIAANLPKHPLEGV